MALSYTQVVGTFQDAQGSPLSGSGQLAINVPLYASGVPVVMPDVPVQVQVIGGQLKNASGGALQLLDLASTGLVIEGSQTGFWYWTISLTVAGEVLDPWSFFLQHSATPVDLFSLANTAAGGFTSPMTTLGDMISGGTSGAPVRLPGNTTAARQFLMSLGTGSAATAPVWTALQAGDIPQLADYAPTGLTGATAASRYAGATASGAPASGTFAVGDFVVDQTGKIFICTVAGTPGTWTAAGPVLPLTIANGGTGQTAQQAAIDALAGSQGSGQYLRGNGTHVQMSAIQAADVPQLAQYAPTGLTGAQAATSYAGGTVSGHPLSGTWSQGQWVMDQQGHIYACVTGGTPGTWRRVGANPNQFFLDDYCAGDGKVALVSVSSSSAVINTTPLPAPGAPSLATATTGGTILAGTYQVQVTYVNRWGETVASSSASQVTTGSTSTLTITSPASTGNATGWYAYVTQAGGSSYTRQQAAGSPTPVGQNLILTAPPTSSGATPPGSDTSAAQIFASTDAGKHILVNGAIGTGAPLNTTILSWQSPTQVTLNANATATQAGCAAFWASDDTANVNACISAASAYAQANAYTAQVIGGDRFYGLAAAAQQLAAPVVFNTQVPMPYPPISGATQKLDFELLGCSENSHAQFWGSTYPNLLGTCLVSFQTAPSVADPTFGVQSVIGGPSGGGAFTQGFANVKIVVKGIQVVCPAYTNMYAYDFAFCAGMRMEGSAQVFAPAVAGVNPMSAFPPLVSFQSTRGCGLRCPAVGNNDDVVIPSFTVEGYETGIHAQDHAAIGRLCTVYNDLAFLLDNTTGLSGSSDELTIENWSCEQVNGGLKCNGGTATVNIRYSSEITSPAYDVQDNANSLSGVFRFTDLSGRAPVVSGAANLEIINDKQARAVQGAPSYTLGTAFQNPWWRNVDITLSRGTTTGILIGPMSAACTTSVGTVTTSPVTFRLPSGWWLNIQGTVKPSTFNAIPD